MTTGPTTARGVAVPGQLWRDDPPGGWWLAGWWSLTWFAWATAGFASLLTVFFLLPGLGERADDAGSAARFLILLLFVDGLF